MEEDILFLERLLSEEPCLNPPMIPNQTKPSIKEPKNSFSMGYEHFSTTLVTNEVAESSIKNLVPIPHECEVTSDIGSESIEPIKDDSLVFTTISKPLFDDDKINSDELNLHVESNSVESTSNHDTVKFDNLDELSGPLIPIHIAKEERIRREHVDYINRMEMLFTINLRPHPSVNANTNVESIPSLLIPVQDGDSQREEIDIITSTDGVLPPGVENDDSDGEVDAVDDLLPLPPPEPPDEEFDFEIDFGDEISVVRNTIVEYVDARVKFDDFNDENDDLSYFMFAKVFSLLSAESEITIFDPVNIEDNVCLLVWGRIYLRYMISVYMIPAFVFPHSYVPADSNSFVFADHVETTILATTPKPASPKPASSGKRRNRKACFVCKSVDHLIKDCDYHAKNMAQPTPRNHAHRGNHKLYAPLTHTNPQKHMVPAAVLTQSKPVSITVVRPVSAAMLKFRMTQPRHAKPFVTKFKSPIRRHLTRSHSPKTSNSPPRVTTVKAPVGNPPHALKDKGVIDSGCSRHMTGNIGLPTKFFENDNTFVTCKKGKQHSASCKTKPVSSADQPLYKLYMDLFGPTFVKSLNKKSYCLVVTDDYSRFTWVFFLATKDDTSPILKTFITGLKNQLSLKVKVIKSDNVTEFKNNDLNQFCGIKGIKREFSVLRTPRQNGIAERKNMTLIEAARTMLTDSLLPIPFWAEAVNTACYVQNRVLVTKPHDKTPYELLHGRTPSIGFMRPFGCPVTILNTLDSLGKFEGKESAGFQDNFDAEKVREEIDQQYVLFPVWSSGFTNPQNNNGDAAFNGKEHDFDVKKPVSEVSVSPSSKFEDYFDNSINEVNAAGTIVLTVGQNSPNSTNTFSVVGPSNVVASPTYGKSSYIDASQLLDDPDMPELEDITYSDDEDDVSAEANFNNLETSITVSPIPTTRVHKDHPVSQIIGDLSSTTQTRSMTRVVKDQGGLSHMFDNDFHNCMFACFLLHEEPKRVHQALKDPSWIKAMHEELLQFKMQKVKQKKDGIFISQDKYVAEILRNFGLTEGKSACTPIDIEKPLLKDPDGEDIDVHTYRSMIGSLIYLTSSRPDIRYLKGKPHLGMWYLKDSPFDLVAYSDSDYAGASLDRKFTTGGCQFLGCRLISWQCKKQTVVATLSTEAEYVATASYCAQVLWIQNQLLDYGDSPLLGVNTPRCDEDRLESMKLTVFLLPKVEKVRIGVNAVDLQVNDVTRLQALVDRKKVVVTEATIRDALRLDYAELVDCLANEEIFAKLARMGYEKPSTKLTFYKSIFSSQWKFLIHTILQCDLSTHITKYTSPDLTQKVFSNIRRVRKGFSGVETPLFEGMLVEQQGDEEEDADEHVEEVNTGDAAEEDDSATHGEVPTVVEEQPIPSPTPHTLPPQPPQDIPSTSQVQQTSPQSPQVQPPSPQLQPQQAANFPMTQALEITKLKRRVKKLEKRNNVRVLKLRRLQRVGTSHRVETSDDTVMDDESNQGRIIAKMDQDDAVVLKDDKEKDKEVVDSVKNVEEAKEDETEPAEVQEVVDVVTTAKLITEVVTAASAIITTAEAQVLAATTATLTAAPIRVTAAPSRRRKGVVIRDPEEESTTSTIIPTEAKSKDKGKEILVEEPKPLKKKQQIEQDEQYARELHAELNKDIDWD
nr:putative ribonuclease H-like domain-containing protein [Tanacetum cinerariifolium]